MLLCHRLFRAGWLASVCGHDWSTLRVHPPLDTSDARLEGFVAAVRESCEFLCSLR
jgi:4-aminobutyrate aminotransferase-like enzyme